MNRTDRQAEQKAMTEREILHLCAHNKPDKRRGGGGESGEEEKG